MAIQCKESLSVTYFCRSISCKFNVYILDMYLKKYVYINSAPFFDINSGPVGFSDNF